MLTKESIETIKNHIGRLQDEETKWKEHLALLYISFIKNKTTPTQEYWNDREKLEDIKSDIRHLTELITND